MFYCLQEEEICVYATIDATSDNYLMQFHLIKAAIR